MSFDLTVKSLPVVVKVVSRVKVVSAIVVLKLVVPILVSVVVALECTLDIKFNKIIKNFMLRFNIVSFGPVLFILTYLSLSCSSHKNVT